MAYVYIRQSSLMQVTCHAESTDLQYSLVERAVLIDASRRLQRGEQQLTLTLGRAPTSRELAQAMQVKERKLRLALSYYTPAQAAGRAQQLDQLGPPNTRRAHYLRDEVDALTAQGQKVSLAGLCQRVQASGKVAGAFLRERQKGMLAVAPQA